MAYGGNEHPHHTYQVLTNPHHNELAWAHAHDGQVPTGALIGGRQSDGVPLYIGRAHYDGSMVVGKVHPEHHVCYVSFGGAEVPIHSYEVLVVRNVQTQEY